MSSSTSHYHRHPARPRLKAWNAFTRWILHIPLLRAMADRQVCELRFTGRRSGKAIVLPVMYAQHDETIVILVGGPESKLWWRNFATPYPVTVWLQGASRKGKAHVVDLRSPERARAGRIYTSKFPDLPVEADPMVVIDLDPAPASIPGRDPL